MNGSEWKSPVESPECLTSKESSLPNPQKISPEHSTLADGFPVFPAFLKVGPLSHTGIDPNSKMAVMTPRQSNGLMNRWFHTGLS